ncbi:methyltransferase domain-containing protein [Sphingomonas xanthus]|uniref:Methyltransferase domain-containing protein n=1 Tax=Sphingomonas xanthus TaxID=2594473 RepID=A0A516IQ07_9SPHN|nr:methyltransferase domain-containing protein [Sphingomonas xanthus]QDP19003.1 methyltransferase domain-containing protein [Sphingomonas xanthus]
MSTSATSATGGFVVVALILVLAGCRAEPDAPQFPDAGRDVAPIVSDRFSTEDARDRVGEANEVMRLAGVRPGMFVADIGAGEGYYTVRLSPLVGPRGRVLAQDIVSRTRDRLAARIEEERLDNVAVLLGKPDNPMLPRASLDRIFLVHMYHEVTEPYAFLWHLRDGLKKDGLVVVVDADRSVKQHGMPPRLLMCEFAALGMIPVDVARLADGEAYFVAFKAKRPRPAPEAIKPCATA